MGPFYDVSLSFPMLPFEFPPLVQVFSWNLECQTKHVHLKDLQFIIFASHTLILYKLCVSWFEFPQKEKETNIPLNAPLTGLLPTKL